MVENELEKKIDYLVSSFDDLRFQNRLILSILQKFNAETEQSSSMEEDKKESIKNAFVVVYQQVIYKHPINTPVVICKAQVFNTDGSMIKETRTDSKGKWKMELPPGKYLVKLVKGATTDKPSIDMEYQISVPDSSSPVELPIIKTT